MNEGGPKFVVSGDHARRPTSTHVESPRQKARRQRPARGDYAVGAVVVAALAVAAFVFGRERASSMLEPSLEASSTQQHSLEPAAPSSPLARPAPADVDVEVEAQTLNPQRRELALIPFVAIEVEPANGEIWLDRDVAGVGSVQLGAINDGMLHELKFVAPEHETKTLFFRNTPPAGRVVLKRIVRKEAAPVKTAPRMARSEAPPPARAHAVVHDALPDASAVTKKAPRVQLIEVQMPRVEVLD